MDRNIKQRIEKLRIDLLNLYHVKRDFQDPALIRKSVELDKLINTFQKQFSERS